MGKVAKIAGILLIAATIAVGGALYMASRIDIGAATVAAELDNAARQYLQGELSISSISGNPLRGFIISELSLAKDKSILFSSKQATVSFKLLSLVTGSPRVKALSFGGADLDWAKIAPLFTFDKSGGPLSLPFDRFDIIKSIVRTPAGDFKVEDGRIQIRGRTIDASGSMLFKGTPFSLKAGLELGQDRLDLNDLEVKIAGGKLSLSGRLTPVVDVSGKISDLNIDVLEKLWPELAKQGYTGTFSTTLSAKGAWPEITVNGNLDIPKGKVYGIEVNKVASPWTFSGNALEIKDLQGKANGTSVSGKILFVFSSMPPITTVDIRAEKAEMKAWQTSFPWLSIAEGTIDSAEVRLNGPSNSLSGPITFKASKLTVAKQPLSAVLAALTLEKGSRVLVNLGANWLGSDVTGKGNITIAAHPSFDITLAGKELDLAKAASIIPVKNLDLSGKASGSVRIFGKGQDVQSEGTLWSGIIRTAGETIEKPDIRFAYQKGTITLRSIAARWRETRITGSGTISGLAQEKGVFDLSGVVDETDISSMTGFVPALKDFNLDGRASTNWSLKGPVKTPTLALEIKSPRVSAPGVAKLTGLKILTKLALPPSAEMPDIRIDMAADALLFPDFSIDKIRTALTLSKGRLLIENGQGELFGAALSVSGSAQLASKGKNASVDLKGTVSGIDLSAIGKTAPVTMKGPLEAQISIKGELPDPEIALSGKSSSLVLAGLSLSNLTFAAKGTPSHITIDELKANTGKGTLSAKGALEFKAEGFDMDFSIDGSGLELAQLTKELQGNGAADLAGVFDASLAGSLKGGSWNGKGEMLSNKITAYGLVFTDASVPLVLQGKKFLAEGAKGKFYGGSIAAEGSIETSSGKWNIRASVSGADIAPVLKDAFPMEGQISGRGDMDITLSGAFGKHVLVTGRGNLLANNGEISGFKAIKAVSAAYGMSSLRYRMIDANFKIDGNVITLLPGSRATAHPDDPLYRYFSADGPAGPGGSLNLFCSGLVNVQALNSLLGGIQGLAGAGSGNPQDLLEGLIGGFVGGMGQQDFRNVSFRIRGTWNNPSFSNFKIASPSSSQQSAPAGGGTGQTQSGNQPQVTISIPTGGAADTTPDIEEQIKQKVIDEVLKNVIPGGD
ncbi:MAG: AsmA-like C-terminal region-containing protein [Thermovirgaceae bacterium]|nr:AsmA-like C-terminal region-containing protein [Thermovirgaceae bacterium]